MESPKKRWSLRLECRTKSWSLQSESPTKNWGLRLESPTEKLESPIGVSKTKLESPIGVSNGPLMGPLVTILHTYFRTGSAVPPDLKPYPDLAVWEKGENLRPSAPRRRSLKLPNYIAARRWGHDVWGKREDHQHAAPYSASLQACPKTG